MQLHDDRDELQRITEFLEAWENLSTLVLCRPPRDREALVWVVLDDLTDAMNRRSLELARESEALLARALRDFKPCAAWRR